MLIKSYILLEGLDHVIVDTAHQPDLDLHICKHIAHKYRLYTDKNVFKLRAIITKYMGKYATGSIKMLAH